jgi:hypothetical protein
MRGVDRGGEAHLGTYREHIQQRKRATAWQVVAGRALTNAIGAHGPRVGNSDREPGGCTQCLKPYVAKFDSRTPTRHNGRK